MIKDRRRFNPDGTMKSVADQLRAQTEAEKPAVEQLEGSPMPEHPTLYIGVHVQVPDAVKKQKKPDNAKAVQAFALVIPGVLAIPWPEDMTWEEAMQAFAERIK